MKNYKSLISMCIFATLANCGKSEVSAARELPNGRTLVYSSTAQLPIIENMLKTRYMIAAPDGKSGFANNFMTNAISIVTEDCTNYYAHIQNENGDRTKVIHFTLDKNGIPSKTGDIIDTTNSGETSNATKMKKRKLTGIKNGFLYFLNSSSSEESLIYNPQTGVTRTKKFGKVTASCQNDSNLYMLAWKTEAGDFYSGDFDGSSITTTTLYKSDANGNFSSMSSSKNTSTGYTTLTVVGNKSYIGNSSGDIRSNLSGTAAKLPGAISSLSNNGDEVFATTTKTNAFYNVTLKKYNVVKDENGNPKPMVPQTNEGLLRVIDNRKKNGKFLYVTPKGIHSIE